MNSDEEILAQLEGEKGSGTFNTFLSLTLVAIVLALPILGFMLWQRSNATPVIANKPSGPAQPITWYYTMQEGLNIAAMTNKPIAINFYTNWCGACKWMDANTFTNPEVQLAAQNFVAVKIDADRFPEVADHYGVRAYPTTVWTDSRGNERHRERGGIQPARFVWATQKSS